MKDILYLLVILLFNINTFSQTKPNYFDRFDFELSYNHYKDTYSNFEGEHLHGKVKELKKLSSRIKLHLILNKKGEIIEKREYSDSVQLSRIINYLNQKITKETAYNLDGTENCILYKYNKKGHLTSKDFFSDNIGQKLITSITYHYNNIDQLVRRQYGTTRTEEFIYEGDSILWKLIFSSDTLKGVIRKLKKDGYELVTNYQIDAYSNKDFKERIKPSSEFLTKWNKNMDIIEETEFQHDSLGHKTTKSIKKYEYADKVLQKSNYEYNTIELIGQFTSEYFYNDRGLLESEISKHDSRVEKREYKYNDQGDMISNGGLIYRFFYDKNGNWISKQRFNKKNSVMTETRNGIIKSKRYNEDTWTDEEKREISYFN